MLENMSRNLYGDNVVILRNKTVIDLKICMFAILL